MNKVSPSAAELAAQACTACRADSPPASASERARWLPLLPQWRVDTSHADGVERLVGDFSFANFAGALGFANQVGAIADAEDHHPEITIEWGHARVVWWTHTIRGLHTNDFVMAARTSALAGST